MIKRCLIGFFLIMTLAFLPLKINALELHNINELGLFAEDVTEDYLYNTLNIDKETYPYVIIWAKSSTSSPTKVEIELKFYDRTTAIGFNNSGYYLYKSNYVSDAKPGYNYITVGSKSNIVDYVQMKSYSNSGGGSGSLDEHLYYFSNFDVHEYASSTTLLDTIFLPANNISDYNLTFDLNGGVADYSTMTLPANINLNDYLNYAKESGWYKEPTKIGFQFGGWTYDICTGIDENDNCIYETLYLENNPNTILDQDMTLKASWSPSTAYLEQDMETLTFDTNYKYLAISYPDNNKDRYLTIKGSIVPGTAYYYASDKWNYVDGYSYRPLDFEYNAFKIHDSNYNKQYYLLSKELLSMNNPDYTFSIHKGANLYYLNDPNSENIGFVDSSGTSNDFTFGDDTVIFDDSFTYVGEDKDEIVDLGLFQPLLDLVYDKLPIINQFSDILNQFNFNEEVDEPPVFKVNIPYFNLNDVEVFNFQFFLEYRDYIINLQCFVLGIYTAIKAFKIVKGYFGGDTGE